jgi:hypothetical protein
MSRHFVIASLLLLTACDPTVPPELLYDLRVALTGVENHDEESRPFAGVDVILDGQRVASLVHHPALLDAEFTTPSSVRPSSLRGRLTLRAQTVCGDREIPLVLDVRPGADSDESVAEAMEEGRVVLWADVTPPPHESRPLFVDWGTGTPAPELRVGERRIEPGATESLLLSIGCEGVQPVKVGGEPIGTWFPTAEATFVSVESGCHRLRTVSYGHEAVAGGAGTVFSERVRSLTRAPSFFLEPAPASVSSRGQEEYYQELVRAECPAQAASGAATGAELATSAR